MKNGYALAPLDGLSEISKRLKTASEMEWDELRRLLRIGIQWDTQVTLGSAKHIVTQAYCSALPVAYSHHPAASWEEFARLILEAAYEATLCAAILNSANTKNNRFYLTLLGGGVFGNEPDWILDGLKRSLVRYVDWDIDVGIVSYGTSKPGVPQLIEELSRYLSRYKEEGSE